MEVLSQQQIRRMVLSAVAARCVHPPDGTLGCPVEGFVEYCAIGRGDEQWFSVGRESTFREPRSTLCHTIQMLGRNSGGKNSQELPVNNTNYCKNRNQ